MKEECERVSEEGEESVVLVVGNVSVVLKVGGCVNGQL